jgi:hypothetical protein
MAAPRNRSKSASISKSALDQVGSLLQDLSAKPKQEMSIREAIDQLRGPIQAAMAKGYTYEDIVQILSESGISTTVTTVKRYISLGNPPRRKTGGKGQGKRAAATVEEVEAEAEPPAPKATRGKKAAVAEAPVETPPKPATRGRKPSSTTATRGRKKST